MPVGQWLRNGVVIVAANPNLRSQVISIDDGIYQCMGLVENQPETDFTGESGSNLYLLTPGMYTCMI